METVAATHAERRSRTARPSIDGSALGTWALAGGLVMYLGLNGGGYDIVVRGQVGVVLWWIVLVCAAWGILPATRLTRLAWGALALFGGFVVWNALAVGWSISSERSLQELSRVACYLGVLLLGIAMHRDRERAVRRTVAAVAVAIVAVATVAVISRLSPGAFSGSHTTGAFLGGVKGRLAWPLNYWNGLAALMAVGAPLLLAIATSARRLVVQAVAAAALPLLILCEYLTFSRGGAASGIVAVIAFFVLAPDRIPKLATGFAAAAGGAILVAGAVHRGAIEQGLLTHATSVQGRQLYVTIVLVCVGTGLAQAGIGIVARHGTLPRALHVSPGRGRALLAATIVAVLVVAVAAGAPSRLSHAWHDFKVQRTTVATAPSRFGSAAGNGRYDLWRVALDSTSGHLLNGSGPGTYQLLWQPRAPVYTYVINAHSLYIETLAEVGLVGLALLVGFLALVLGAGVRLVAASTFELRAQAAGATAAMLAFAVSAIADWTWQLPVLPAAFLLLAAAVLAPAPAGRRVRASARDEAGAEAVPGWRRFLIPRAATVVTALACLVVIGIPLATVSAVRKSQAAAAAGNPTLALADARSATQLDPDAASPQLQEALVLELQHDYPAALAAARRATVNEPANWTEWLVVSRLEAESGHAGASLAAYRRARSLNPRSPLFARR